MKNIILANKNIYLEPFNGKTKQIKKLFTMLNNRKYNISNDSKTDYENHLKFCEKNPYRKWFLIKLKSKYIGSLFITYQNEVSINLETPDMDTYASILNMVLKNIKPLRAIPSVRNKSFVCNTNPKNKTLKQALKNMDSIKIQESYVL
tara:strand:+ start:330 stop:773 length:444 start_codon:yes stop_codon:yes gene_type:complete